MSSMMEPRGWRPGDIANGHVLLDDGRWVPLVPPPTVNSNSMALAPVMSLVTGLFGVMVCWVPFVGIVGWLLGPIAILFGLIGIRRGPSDHRLVAAMGVCCGVLTVTVCALYLVLFVYLSAS